MSSRRFLCFALVALLAPLITIPASIRFSPAAPSTSSATGETEAPAATCLVEQAAAFLHPARLAWLQTNLWQRVQGQGLEYEAQGRYVSGPNHKILLHLVTQAGALQGTLHLVCDGQSVWKATRIGAGEGWDHITRVHLPAVFAPFPPSPALDQVRDEFLRSESFGGVHVLLGELRRQVTWTRKEMVRRNSQELIRLTGLVNAEAAQAVAATGSPCPVGVPRKCRLYLDPQTLWPHRVEWWGDDPPRSGEALLLQMEFRNPILNRPGERALEEFAFDPRQVAVEDQTALMAERLRTRIQQIAATLKSSEQLAAP